ncbi:MAG TPA: hypothetical protein VHO24_12210 [Opitutaceae bacterium]|nr:hypothetical protein [Opitutaceae bacterium]
MLSARLNVRHLRERIHHQPVRLDEPVQERVRGKMIFLFCFRGKFQASAPLHERIGANVAQNLPGICRDHSPHPCGGVAHVLRIKLTASQIDLVVADELSELCSSRDAHRFRRDDAFSFALFVEYDGAKPFSRDLTVRGVEADLHRLGGLIDCVAATEHA